MKYTALLALGLLFVGCGDENKTHTTQKMDEKTTEVVKEAPKKEEKTVAKLPTTVAPAPIKKEVKKEEPKVVDAKTLYSKCAGCHGANGKNKALGKSAPIGGWDALKVKDALNGYKKGTRNIYGMGAVMKGQVSNLSEADIEALSDYISKL